MMKRTDWERRKGDAAKRGGGQAENVVKQMRKEGRG